MQKTLLFLLAVGLAQGLKVPHPDCPDENYHNLLPHEYDCTKFYYCEGGEKFVIPRNCPPGTEFSAEQQVCIHPSLANCFLPGAPPDSPTTVSSDDPTAAPSAAPTAGPSAAPTAAPSAAPTAAPTAVPTTALPGGTTDCERFENGCPVDFDIDEYFEHETYCRSFYRCVRGEKVLQRCPRGTFFDIRIPACNHAWNMDRTCEDDASSSEEDPPLPNDPDTIEFQDNGCPVDSSISWYFPHDYYCNVYFQCVHGYPVIRWCSAGTQFNPNTKQCDHAANVNCVGGIAIQSTTQAPVVTEATTRNPGDLQENGCPVDNSINWLVPHEDCTKFYYCVWGDLVLSHCPSGLHFSPSLQRCENPAIAGCANGPCSSSPCSGEDPDYDGDTEEDLPPGGDDEDDLPPGGDDEDDLPPGGDDEDDLPPGGDDEDDLPPGGDDTNNRCEEDCHVLPWAHEDCDKFWVCYGNKALLGVCSNGLYFNPSTSTCDFACNVDCDSSKVLITPSHDGVKLYIPWNKVNNNARQLLKLIGEH